MVEWVEGMPYVGSVASGVDESRRAEVEEGLCVGGRASWIRCLSTLAGRAGERGVGLASEWNVSQGEAKKRR